MKTIRLVIYDIGNDKFRTKLAKVLKVGGLYRIQKSAFAGSIDEYHWKALWKHVTALVDKFAEEEDAVFAIKLSPAQFLKMQIAGELKDIDMVAGKREVMVI